MLQVTTEVFIKLLYDCFLCRTRWIRICGTLYKPSCVVVLGVEDDYPVFAEVKGLFVVNSLQPHFEIVKLKTIEFNSHHHFYVVERPSPLHALCVTHKNLLDPHPLHLRRASVCGHVCLSVVVKHHILGIVQC